MHPQCGATTLERVGERHLKADVGAGFHPLAAIDGGGPWPPGQVGQRPRAHTAGAEDTPPPDATSVKVRLDAGPSCGWRPWGIGPRTPQPFLDAAAEHAVRATPTPP